MAKTGPWLSPRSFLGFCLFGLRQLEDGRVCSGSQFEDTQSVTVGKAQRQKCVGLHLLSGSRDEF